MLPGAEAVALGGSRAPGTHRPDNDWDFSIYYRRLFDPQALRDLGWPGEVFEVGGWSKGVFNGWAWLQIDGRKTDVHHRDLDVRDREIAASQDGQFDIEPLSFHLAGAPSYLVPAELAVRRVLHGQLPTPEYPTALRERAPKVWWGRAEQTFGYARANHVPWGGPPSAPGSSRRRRLRRRTRCWPRGASGSPTRSRLLTRAGLRQVDDLLAAAGPDPAVLRGLVEGARPSARIRQL